MGCKYEEAHHAAPSTVRPLARDPRVLIGWPFPLGFGLGGRLLLALRGRVYVQFIIIIIIIGSVFLGLGFPPYQKRKQSTLPLRNDNNGARRFIRAVGAHCSYTHNTHARPLPSSRRSPVEDRPTTRAPRAPLPPPQR